MTYITLKSPLFPSLLYPPPLSPPLFFPGPGAVLMCTPLSSWSPWGSQCIFWAGIPYRMQFFKVPPSFQSEIWTSKRGKKSFCSIFLSLSPSSEESCSFSPRMLILLADPCFFTGQWFTRSYTSTKWFRLSPSPSLDLLLLPTQTTTPDKIR